MRYLIPLIVMPIIGIDLIMSASNDTSCVCAVLRTMTAAIAFFGWARVIGEAVTKLLGVE